MNKIWELFDTADALVYTSEMDNHELVYMNKKALRTYGFHSLADISSKKCYEVLKNCSVPCPTCDDHELKQGYFKECRCYDPVLKEQVTHKTAIIEADGKKYRMELTFDAETPKQHDSMMLLEAQINKGVRVALQQETPSQTLQVLLEYVGKALGGMRTYIFERNENGYDDNTYEWVADGVTPMKDSLQNLPAEVCANWYRNFRVGRHIVIKNIENIQKSDPLQYKNLKRQDIHSLIVIPLYDERKLIGFYGIDNPSGKSLDYASDMLQIMAHFIISSLKRRNLIRKLKEMSYRDQLTQIGNRYAMNEYIGGLQSEQSLGIVYCDITGLKQVNDREGHAFGDKLILDACECLKKSFGDYGLFRIGGDELLAICAGIEEAALWQGIDRLKKHLKDGSVHMAIGGIWDKNHFGGVEKLITAAETKMYQDKAAYYSKYGTDRRHRP